MAFSRKGGEQAEMSFLEHLEELRWHLMRSVIAIGVFFVTAFVNKEIVFDKLVFGPMRLDFLTYDMLCRLSYKMGLVDRLCLEAIPFTVINLEMAGQFLLHIKVSFVLGLVLAFPYIFWEFWRFISPGLHKKERKYARGIVFYCSMLFFMGVSFGYLVLTPFSINFLGSYQVTPDIVNTISISSYTSLLIMFTLFTGIIFELPIVVYILSKVGIVTPSLMKSYRKHSIITILILSAVITPPDWISQVMISLPLFILYEVSIFISARTYKEVV
jgi:sec-independent protein translocase protein TatC